MTGASLIRARSISSHVAGILGSGNAGRVLASFEHACTLVTGGGEIATLVWNGIGNGPLNVVLEAGPCPTPPVGTHFDVLSGGEVLLLQTDTDGAPILHIDLSHALQWNPRPDWHELHLHQRRVLANAARVAEISEGPRSLALQGTAGSRLKKAQEGVCTACRNRDQQALKLAIGGLCGAGEGLTPAGDDWLAGWLLALWLMDVSDSSLQAVKPGSASPRLKPQVHGHGSPHTGQGPWGVSSIGCLIPEIAKERTTLPSRALLGCAAAGEADESWHTLLRELARHPQDAPSLTRVTRQILAHGATSGAATLSGFLAGLSQETSSPETDSER